MCDLILKCAVALMLGGCAASGPTVGLPDADSVVVATYEVHCGGCHGLPHPGRHSAAEWPVLVGMMEKRMKERAMTPLGADERKTILGYLQKHAR